MLWTETQHRLNRRMINSSSKSPNSDIRLSLSLSWSKRQTFPLLEFYFLVTGTERSKRNQVMEIAHALANFKAQGTWNAMKILTFFSKSIPSQSYNSCEWWSDNTPFPITTHPDQQWLSVPNQHGFHSNTADQQRLSRTVCVCSKNSKLF